MQYHKPRMRKVRILATLGPASDTPEMIEKLFRAGADAFRVNMSHGEQADKAQLIANIRALEKAYNRPTTILVDLQGPKLRVGTFAEGKVELRIASICRIPKSLPHWKSAHGCCLMMASLFCGSPKSGWNISIQWWKWAAHCRTARG